MNAHQVVLFALVLLKLIANVVSHQNGMGLLVFVLMWDILKIVQAASRVGLIVSVVRMQVLVLIVQQASFYTRGIASLPVYQSDII